MKSRVNFEKDSENLKESAKIFAEHIEEAEM